jgi:hypothetical protein
MPAVELMRVSTRALLTLQPMEASQTRRSTPVLLTRELPLTEESTRVGPTRESMQGRVEDSEPTVADTATVRPAWSAIGHCSTASPAVRLEPCVASAVPALAGRASAMRAYAQRVVGQGSPAARAADARPR